MTGREFAEWIGLAVVIYGWTVIFAGCAFAANDLSAFLAPAWPLFVWRKMRQALNEGRSPKPQIQYVTRIKPRSRLRTLLLLTWRLGVTAAAVADLWGKWRHR